MSVRPTLPPYTYVSVAYGVKPRVGQRITMSGRPGTILRPIGDPQYLRVKFDDSKTNSNVHPTWEIVYGD